MSLWWSLVDHPVFYPGDLKQPWDVVIVGAGFSGLWTAYHLKECDPHLKIAILEKDLAGSGASGRNGGWASALYPIEDRKLLTHFSQHEVDDLHKHLRQTIDDIGNFIATENIDCGFTKGGSLIVARNQGQLHRLGSHVEDGYELLNLEETQLRVNMSNAQGSIFTPHCAALNPAALLVGLARTLEKRGVSIFENSFGDISRKNSVSVGGAILDATYIVRAVEAYHECTRDQVPIYSLMIATEPLPTYVFDEIGIAKRETFAEGSHLVTYAQRTADNRLAIGGRGAPYTWGSRRKDSNEHHRRDHERLRQMAKQWFPILEDFQFTHSWGGAVGVTRDWAPFVRADGKYGELGGYAGDGVALSYLAAGAMADLIQKRESDRVKLPFVQWKNLRWEPEPLRWLAINSAIKLSGLADRQETRTNRPSRFMKPLSRITGQ